MPTTPRPRPAAPDDQVPGPTLQAYLLRVLDQMSVSAWIPGVYVMTCLVFVVHFACTGAVVPSATFEVLTANALQLAVLVVPGTVLTTLVMQAFCLDAVRVLAGDWPDRRPLRGLHRHMVRRQGRRLDLLLDRCDEVVARAVADHLEATGREPDLAAGDDWLLVVRPEIRAVYASVLAERLRWPAPSRCKATRLGSFVERGEACLGRVAGNPRTVLLGRTGGLAVTLQQQYAEYRTRLDLYCTLVFANWGLTAASAALLLHARLRGPDQVWRVGGLVLAFVLLSRVCHGAAVRTARDYADVLEGVAEHLADGHPAGAGTAGSGTVGAGTAHDGPADGGTGGLTGGGTSGTARARVRAAARRSGRTSGHPPGRGAG